MNEKELMKLIKEIMQRGNAVELVKDENGKMLIYEVKRELIAEIPSEAGNE